MSRPWTPFTELADAIKKVVAEIDAADRRKWWWSRNKRCKYINICIDMRDGHCVLSDRHGERITIDQLREQVPRPHEKKSP